MKGETAQWSIGYQTCFLLHARAVNLFWAEPNDQDVFFIIHYFASLGTEFSHYGKLTSHTACFCLHFISLDWFTIWFRTTLWAKNFNIFIGAWAQRGFGEKSFFLTSSRFLLLFYWPSTCLVHYGNVVPRPQRRWTFLIFSVSLLMFNREEFRFIDTVHYPKGIISVKSQ